MHVFILHTSTVNNTSLRTRPILSGADTRAQHIAENPHYMSPIMAEPYQDRDSSHQYSEVPCRANSYAPSNIWVPHRKHARRASVGSFTNISHYSSLMMSNNSYLWVCDDLVGCKSLFFPYKLGWNDWIKKFQFILSISLPSYIMSLMLTHNFFGQST